MDFKSLLGILKPPLNSSIFAPLTMMMMMMMMMMMCIHIYFNSKHGRPGILGLDLAQCICII